MHTTTTKGALSFGTILLIIVALAILGGIIWIAGQDETAQQQTSFSEAVNYEITGIDPGAGITENTETALEEYQLNEWTLKKSSAATMLSALQDAVGSREPIIVTAWEPHSAFAVADLRKLDDPKGVYNDPTATKQFLEQYAPQFSNAEVNSDVLASVVYDGFSQDAPAAYEFLEQFQIPAETQSEWIFQFNVEDREPSEIAREYVNTSTSTIQQWKPDAETSLGKEALSIGLPPWPGATVKSHVVKVLLEDIGYEVETKEMDPGIMYTALADEQIDITVAGWLPTTHQSYWSEKGEQLDIAGINVLQTWLGLAVPDYVDPSIQSIEDLQQ